MTAEVHQHPDGFVYIRTDIGTYKDTPANLAIDFGAALPILPGGADDRIYTQGVRHAVMGNGNVIEGGPMPWPLGDQLLAGIISILAAQTARVAVITAALPAKPIVVSAFVLLSRLTATEYAAIMQAAAVQLAGGSGQLALWVDLARTSAAGIEIGGVTTNAAKAALVMASLLTQERADIVFAAP